MKADIYKHVGTETGPGIRLGSSSSSNLSGTINFVLF